MPGLLASQRPSAAPAEALGVGRAQYGEAAIGGDDCGRREKTKNIAGLDDGPRTSQIDPMKNFAFLTILLFCFQSSADEVPRRLMVRFTNIAIAVAEGRHLKLDSRTAIIMLGVLGCAAICSMAPGEVPLDAETVWQRVKNSELVARDP